MNKSSINIPHLGFGLGLRSTHYPHIFEHWPKVDWFEVISENFMDTDGQPLRDLERVRERYPVVLHGVGMSIGTVDPLNSEYLQKLKKLMSWLEPAWVSDHLCWTGVAHKNSHDLLPVPYTEEALAHIVERIKQVQDIIERPLALENPSTYLEFKSSHMAEAEFIARMAEESGCQLLLDVNNVYVTCFNHRLDPKLYLDTLPLEKVVQIHLSGHTNKGNHIVDTHDNHVIDDVWTLYQYVVHQAGRTPNTMVEWDDNIPKFDVLYAELNKAKKAASTASEHVALPNLASAEQPYIANITTPIMDEQSRMQDAIFLGAQIDSKPHEWIRSKKDFPPEGQLGVYVKAYRYRLYDVTAAEYPVLKHYLGDAVFDLLLKDFVNIAQSDHFNLGHYPMKLPHFLTHHEVGDVFSVEMAELEKTMSQLKDAPETEVLTQEHLRHHTPESFMEMLLRPREALQLMTFTYPINRYYRAVTQEESPNTPAPESCHMALFRHEGIVWHMDIEHGEYQLLQALFSGLPIGKALEKMQIADDSLVVEAQLSRWFSRWISHGILTTS